MLCYCIIFGNVKKYLCFFSFIETYVWRRLFLLQMRTTTPGQIANLFLKALHGLFLEEVNWGNTPEIIRYLHFFATSLIWAAMSYSDLPHIQIAIRYNTQCALEHVKCNKYVLLISQHKTLKLTYVGLFSWWKCAFSLICYVNFLTR